MKRRFQPKLTQELRDAGAAPQDAAELVRLAAGLTRLKAPVAQHTKVDSRWLLGSTRRWAWPVTVLGTAAGLLAGLMLVALAQTSLPGNWLYPVKRASETIALQTQPNYRGVLMMRRAGEVRALVGHNGSPRLVATTLQAYTNDATIYRAQTSQNYAAFRYCQANLQQAEGQASGPERQQIAAALAALPADSN